MLEFIKKIETDRPGSYGLYKCVCGKEKIIRINAVKSGSTKSCGCHRQKIAVENGKCATTHNKTGTYLYWLWHTKVKNNCTWNSFEDFLEWAEPLWTKGLTIYDDSNSVYNPQTSKFISSKESKLKNTIKTCNEKYGCDSPLQNKQIKIKIEKTNLKRYGNEHACKTDEVKNKTKINNRKKYGVDYPQQLEERRLKQKLKAISNIGFDSEEWAQKLQISRSGFSANVRKYGFDQAINISKHQTYIENRIETILKSLNIKYECQKYIDKFRPDFLFTDHNIIIEADGLYWHSDAVNTDNNYHKLKMDTYSSLGYRTLFFRENEINSKYDIIFSIIQNSIKQSNKIFARKCEIVNLNRQQRKDFFSQNHLMGRGYGECFALTYNNNNNNNIVCALQYTNKNDIIDISRFCNCLNTNVVGGFSRLLTAVIREENPKKVQTFIDKRYGVGDYLYSLGFTKISECLSFVWVKNDQTFHRLKFRGNSGYDFGCYKLWDCGQAKFELLL